MFIKLFDRIQSAAIMNKVDAYGSYISEAERERRNRAAGKTDDKASKEASDKTAAKTTKPESNPAKDSEKAEPKKDNATESTTKDTSPNKEENPEQANPVGEASMNSGSFVKDQDAAGVVNLGCGVTIDMNKINKTQYEATADEIAAAAAQSQNAYLDYIEKQKADAASFAAAAAARAAQMQSQPGMGRHSIDNPVPPKPEVKKSEEDAANIDLSQVDMVDTNPAKPPKQWPDTVSNPLPQAEPIPQSPIIPAYDNSFVFSKYKNCKYLKNIEKLAVECGVQIQMIPMVGKNNTDSGLITCLVYTPEMGQQPNPFKSFTIDTGMIIDKRAKLFPAVLNYGFEDVPAYPVLIKKEEGDGNVLNEKLFRDIFIGGIKMIEGVKPLYTQKFMELNKNVAMITMPTGNMNKETRLEIRDRLINALEKGVFNFAHEIDPYARFRFDPKRFDKKTHSFVLTSVGVPYRFLGQVLSKKPVEIEFTPDKTTVKELKTQ